MVLLLAANAADKSYFGLFTWEGSYVLNALLFEFVATISARSAIPSEIVFTPFNFKNTFPANETLK
jgi:hypothetical protein